jgi:hypothetical protein
MCRLVDSWLLGFCFHLFPHLRAIHSRHLLLANKNIYFSLPLTCTVQFLKGQFNHSDTTSQVWGILNITIERKYEVGEGWNPRLSGLPWTETLPCSALLASLRCIPGPPFQKLAATAIKNISRALMRVTIAFFVSSNHPRRETHFILLDSGSTYVS